MKKMFSCSSSQVAAESWSKRDQKLLEAVEKGDVGRVAALAARKAARPAKLNAAGQSALHLAASKGLTACLTLLLAHGAPVNERDEDGSTALHLATIACQPQCVKVLLQYGANESHVDGQSRTPLHWAASSGCASSVLLLCDHEALPDAADGKGQTPLMIAARSNHAAVCAQLLQRGADPDLADRDMKTALILACESGSVEAAELLLSHGAAVTPRDRDGRDARHYARQVPSRALRRLLRAAGRGAPSPGNGAACPGSPETQASPACDSEEEEEEEEKEEEEEEEEGCGAEEWRCRCEAERTKALQLEQQLATKTRECERLSAGIREQARELERLLPGAGSVEPSTEPSRDAPEGECCLSLLAERVRELRRRKEEEEERGRPRELEGPPENAPGALAASERELRALLAPFLAWLRDACAGLREEKLGAFARSAALRKEVEEALRSKLHYEVVPADAVRKSLAAWEKLALELERALSRADESGAELLRRSRPLLEILGAPRSQQAPEQPLPAPEPSQGNSTNPGRSGAGAPESDAEERSGELEKEVLELKESNGKLLGELARLGRERERLQEELRGLRERDAGAEAPGRLRQRLAEQRRELTALRDDLSARAREEAGSQRSGACILQELHRKLDGLVRKQHEALQLVSQMEGEDEDAGGGDAVAGLRRELEAAGAEAARWAEAAAAERRAKEELEARAARREREARELRAAAQELERSVEKLSAKAGELARTCQDKEGKIKQLLAETEKLSAEVLAVRSESARLQLRLEVQRKNHRDVVTVYRTHLLNAAQGFMDEAAHAVLLQILHAAEA